MHFAHGSLSPQIVKRAANGRMTDSGFKKKAHENNKSQRSVSTSECPAIVGFKNQQRAAGFCQALHQPQIVHRNGFELFADTVAEAIRSRRGCRPMGLAGRFARTQARSGQFALGFGLPLESAARRLAASVRQFQSIRHPSRRPARQISLLFSRRRFARLNGIAP
jgi:hypothetical protein